MADTIDVEGIIADNAAARAALMLAFDAVPAARRIETWYGDWSLKDLVVHLAAWQESWAAGMDQIARGERPQLPEYEGDDDAFNAARVAEHDGDSWESAVRWLRESRERHEEAARGMRAVAPAERLAPGRTAHNFVAGPGTHDREHIPAILEWRQAEGL